MTRYYYYLFIYSISIFMTLKTVFEVDEISAEGLNIGNMGFLKAYISKLEFDNFVFFCACA